MAAYTVGRGSLRRYARDGGVEPGNSASASIHQAAFAAPAQSRSRRFLALPRGLPRWDANGRDLDKASSSNLAFGLKYGQLFMMWHRRVLANYSSAVALSIIQCDEG
jgi:hypothetical protein